ncbi:glycosyl-hydrolase [Cryptococcus wingfieldii CBS 7118]|uniref:Glycosyl-hydrolase n=1 Tax=Cryptococcus wingfieldii CBS 7118 TaxID=1295528 RepID=A0A1E3IW60_9TREE|nr:glycosyl-hydrolase [Cryptococcus wingfieldii CBS 7118]ODN92146.1 glycosyl-hydrolase [Cryptococcus wingfieldii CBS 7118]
MLLPALISLSLLPAIYAQQSIPRVLVYTATAGFRHDSIPTAIEVLGDNADKYGVQFVFSEDKGQFTNDTLSGFDGVMFVSNSDDVLDDSGQSALQTFFQSGGVYAGVHAASACLFNDTNYEQAVGAFFDYHPTIQSATFERLNTTHPSVADAPDQWTFEEEVYHFRSDPRDNGAVVLLTVNETSYVNNGSSTGDYPSMGDPHPIAWYIESPLSALPLAQSASKAGRSFYTSLGHLNSTWQDETFIGHVMEGLKWALDGASTKAYGVGIVGNGTASATNASSSSSATGSSSASGAASSSSATASESSGAEKFHLTGASSIVLGTSGLTLGVSMML